MRWFNEGMKLKTHSIKYWYVNVNQGYVKETRVVEITRVFFKSETSSYDVRMHCLVWEEEGEVNLTIVIENHYLVGQYWPQDLRLNPYNDERFLCKPEEKSFFFNLKSS